MTFRQQQITLIPITVILIILTACKKESADLAPEITLHSPTKHQIFNVLDTIWVSGELNDDKRLTAIKVVLTDPGFNPVHKAFYFYPSGHQFSIDFGYPLDNINLKGGKHYLQIRADDGVNFRNFYQEILLTEVPQELHRIIVLTSPQTGTIQVTAIDNSDQIDLLANIQGDYAGSEISSAHRQLYIAGKTHLNLLAFDLSNLNIAWQLTAYPPFPLHRENCLYFDQSLFVSFYHQFLLGYNASGSVVFNASVEETDSPARIVRSGNYLITDIQKQNSELPHIMTLFHQTGAEKQRVQTNFQVVEFHSTNSNTVVITANNHDNGLILTYDVEQNLLYTEHLISDQINCSVKTDENNILIGTDEAILHYIYDLNQFIVLNTNEGSKRMAYDILNSRIFSVWENSIIVYQYPQMQYQKTFPFSDTILNLHLQYAWKE
ncbi:MAG: hypothetical protein ACNA7V_09600 [Bacteroidales bacterium]